MRYFIYKILSKLNYRLVNKTKEVARRNSLIQGFLGTKNDHILINARNEIVALLEFFPNLVIEPLGEGFVIQIKDQQIFVESAEDIFIIQEVYVDRDYAFNGKGDFVILDIGCNIGIASIFFSQMENVSTIYGFEPVKHTYEQAKRNCTQNILSKHKVNLFNYGLSDRDEILEFSFDKNNKGKTGIRTSQDHSGKITENVEVELKDVSLVLKSYLSIHQSAKIVLKIDCEGGEYKIFRRLDECNLISSVFMFLIEWHDEGSEDLEALLVRNGFIVNNRNLSITSGFIVAFNTNFKI